MSSLRSMSLAGLAVLAIAVPARAAEPTAPAPTGFRADYVQLLAGLEKELVSLEQAMPQDKFSWRPAKGESRRASGSKRPARRSSSAALKPVPTRPA